MLVDTHPPLSLLSECKILLYEIFSGALCFSTLLIAALFVCIINLTNLVWEGGSWKNCHPNSLFHLLKPGAILIIMLPRRAPCRGDAQLHRVTHAHYILCTSERNRATGQRAHVCLDGAFTILHACRATKADDEIIKIWFGLFVVDEQLTRYSYFRPLCSLASNCGVGNSAANLRTIYNIITH